MVLMALEKLRGLDPDRVQSAQERGLGWLLGMQATDGGWASFDTDQKRLYLNNIPFADHGALLDPSTEDLTGRGLELLGTCGYRADFEPARRGLQFLRHTQRHDGPWFGRWGVNYVYGTWSVLRGLRAIGEDPQQEYVQRAVRWLERHQNPDGGWGETCESYDRPELAGKGDSIPSQTAWALLGLLAAGSTNRRVIDAGIGYLLQTQRADGSWEDSRWNGTGFPRVFMLKYHLYAAYFPLWALGGLPGPGGGVGAHPGVGAGGGRAHGDRPGRLGAHRRDRDHADHRADRRAHGDGPEPVPLPGDAVDPGRRRHLPPHDRALRRGGDLRRLPGGGEASGAVGGHLLRRDADVRPPGRHLDRLLEVAVLRRARHLGLHLQGLLRRPRRRGRGAGDNAGGGAVVRAHSALGLLPGLGTAVIVVSL